MNLLRKLLPWPAKESLDYERIDMNIEAAKDARRRLRERRNLDDPIVRRYYGYYPPKRKEAHE